MPADTDTIPLVDEPAHSKIAPVSPEEVEAEIVYYFEEHPGNRFCRSLLALALFLMLGWFVGTVAISAFSLVMDPSNSLAVMVDQTNVKYGQEQVFVTEMVPKELQVFVVNMTEGAEIPEDLSIAFYSCLHTLSPNVVGCVSQFEIPSFEECSALAAEDATGFDLSEPRSIATCGLATLEKSELTLCSLEHPVFLSVWNLEDKHRAIEVTFSYDECQQCHEVEGNCNIYEMYWQSVFLMYTMAIFTCCCCLGCVCGFNKQKQEVPAWE